MKRLWSGFKVFWRWYRGQIEAPPAGALTQENAEYLRSLLDEPVFQTALHQVLGAEIEVERAYMRQWVREGNQLEAARAEGMLSALEDLPSILKGHANKFRTPEPASY